MGKNRRIIGYCACCGEPIYSGEEYAIIDGEYYCNYCGGDEGFAISELKEMGAWAV